MKLKFSGVEDLEFRAAVERYHQEFVEMILLDHIQRHVKNVNVEISDRLRTFAGYAKYSEHLIRLHYYMLVNHPEDLRQTYGHELAHLMSYRLHGRKGRGHGASWKCCMKMLGLEPQRCHDISRVEIQRRKSVKLGLQT